MKSTKQKTRLSLEALEERCVLAAGLGATLVADIVNGIPDSQPELLTEVNGSVYFTADDGVHGRELWISNSAGTRMVKDINPGGNSSVEQRVMNGTPISLINVSGLLYFMADDGSSGFELWRSDGTSAGTFRVADIIPGIGNSSPTSFVSLNGTLYFTALDEVYGRELWRSDSRGTVRLTDIHPNGAAFDPVPGTIVAAGSKIFMTADDGQHGTELWIYDPSIERAQIVKDIVAGLPSSGPASMTDLGGTLFFSAYDSTNGRELWKSDGTLGGTMQVKNLRGKQSSNPDNLTPINGTLFFTADDNNGVELWKSNGSGASLVMDIFPGSFKACGGAYGHGCTTVANSSSPADLTNGNGVLYFSAQTSASGCELWRSDGTSGGTRLVNDIVPGAAGSDPTELANVSGRIYFSATDGTHGRELWQTDGSAISTVMVQDIFAGQMGSYPGSLVGVNGKLYFAATDALHGRELWDPPPVQANPMTAFGDVAGLDVVRRSWRSGFDVWSSNATELRERDGSGKVDRRNHDIARVGDLMLVRIGHFTVENRRVHESTGSRHIPTTERATLNPGEVDQFFAEVHRFARPKITLGVDLQVKGLSEVPLRLLE